MSISALKGAAGMNARTCTWVAVQLYLVFSATNASADPLDTETTRQDYKWFLSIYSGVHTNEDLHEMAVLEADYSGGNYVTVVALAREIYRYGQWVSVELEGQVGKHYGNDNDHWEFVGAILGRWHPFPWDKYIDTSFAMGAGLSYNSEISETESQTENHPEHLLGYLAFELTFGLPQYPRWDLMLRIHHRSGAKELIGEGVSNYLCAGVKFAF
jgi:hypothetical protein